jgi:hypothetical protein
MFLAGNLRFQIAAAPLSRRIVAEKLLSHVTQRSPEQIIGPDLIKKTDLFLLVNT